MISNTRASEPGTITSLSNSLGTWTYRVSPGLALVGLKVILFTVRSAFMAPRTFFECEGSRLGGTAMVYNVFSKLICILVMAEGADYDPATEKDPLIPGTGNDNDDADNIDWEAPVVLDPEEPDKTQPFEPGGASTPYPEGEEHEMSSLPQEQSGMAYTPGEPAWNALTYLYPDASATELEAFMDPTTHRLKIKITGQGKKAYFLLTEDKSTKKQKLNPQLTKEIKKALGESALDQVMTLQEQRDRNASEIRVRLQEREQLDVQVQELQENRQEMDAIRNQIKQLENDIHALEDKAGPSLDEATIQRFKDEKRALEAEHQRKREQYDQTRVKVKESLQLQTEINDLKLANRDIDRQMNKLGVKPTRMLDELVQEKAELEK